jgi:hypothetical protein
MVLFLRKQAAQTRLERQSSDWKDDDYAVVEDTVIGRIYRLDGGPSDGTWVWFLNRLPPGDHRGLILSGGELTLDAAKAALRVQYEKWKARR